MSRSHAWVKRGAELIDHIPANWGRKNLTLLGAIRLRGWVVLRTIFDTTNSERFVDWLRTRLLPKLTRGDVLVMDNLNAHKAPGVAVACKKAGVRVVYLPPCSQT